MRKKKRNWRRHLTREERERLVELEKFINKLNADARHWRQQRSRIQNTATQRAAKHHIEP